MGDAIAAHAFDELARMGVTGIEQGWPPVGALHLVGPDGSEVTGRAARPNRVIPRETFDTELVDRATALGANLLTERVRTVVRSRGRFIVNGHHRAPALIAADGANSVVRRQVKVWSAGRRRPWRGGKVAPPAGHSRHQAIAIRAYASTPRHEGPSGPGTQHIEFLAQGWPAYAWSFPLPDGRANVGYGLRTSEMGSGGRPELLRRLQQALPEAQIDADSVAGHPLPFSTGRPPATQGGVLFVGDAAGLINPLTGEGIFYAIASGRMAARAVTLAARPPAALYRAMLRRRFGAHFATTGALARLLDIQGLMPLVIRAGRDPGAFRDLTEIGLGEGRVTLRLLRAAIAPRVSQSVVG